MCDRLFLLWVVPPVEHASVRNSNHLLLRLFKPIRNERKGDFNGKSNKFYGTYKMDVQISYVSNYSTKDKCIVIYGIFKRKKCAYDIRSTRKLKV